MALISSGIERLRVFELPSGIWPEGRSVAEPRLALVRWRSCRDSKLYQIYVNGRYAGTTIDADQRQMTVQIPTSLERPVRIEVFAVGLSEADVDFSREMGVSKAGSGRVKISFLRSQNLPLGSTAQIYFDQGGGEVDYDNPLNNRPIRIWASWRDKAGFGVSRFGFSDFGWDSAAAVGFGRGIFGNSQFGIDADAIEWVSRPMQAGVYKFAIKVVNEAGYEGNSSEISEVTVIPGVRPAEKLSIYSFDKQANQLILNIA